MFNHFFMILLMLFLVLSAGCPSAEFIQVPITTTPPGATVSINGVPHTTPTMVVVPRDIEPQPLVFKHRDFPDRAIAWKKEVAGQFIWDSPFGFLGVPFLFVDVLRLGGRGWAMEPAEIHLDLQTGCYLDGPEGDFGVEPICLATR